MNVVSFYAPRPEHPFFQDYRPYLALLRESCERFGHQHLVLTDDPMEIGADDAYVCELPRSLMKAVIAAQYAYLSDPANAHVPTLLVGADCVLANDPARFAEIDADLVITVGDFADCRMNTGAIYIPHPCQVAEIWAEALRGVGDIWGDDQTALYQAILQRPTHGVWSAKVVEVPVDPFNLAPEHPADDCRRGVVLHFRGPRKRWMAAYCKQWLDIGDGVTINLLSNVEDAQIEANVRSAVSRGLAVIEHQPPHGSHAVLVGGGPSLAGTLDEIRRRQADGQHVFALNGAGWWLEQHGVKPDYGVILDARPENARFVGPASVYLLASQCAPETFDAAKDYPTLLWHVGNDPTVAVAGRKGTWFVNASGITVGLTAMALVFLMGYRKIHLYGYDSSDADAGPSHAFEQTENEAESRRVEAWLGSQRFRCAPAMYAQAQLFPELATALANEGAVITVHGTGLLPAVAHAMVAAQPIEKDMAA